MTAIFMGSAYAAGCYLFVRAASQRRWHAIRAAVLPSAIFAALGLTTTLLHWDRFNHGDAPLLGAVAFYGWVGVYGVTPPLLAVAWLRNRRTDPGKPEPDDLASPRTARWLAGLVAVIALLSTALLLLWPAAMIEVWPWRLTPLTARILGCFGAQLGVAAAILALESRWSTWRLPVQAFLVGSALVLVGLMRAWRDLDWTNPVAWALVVGLTVTALALTGLHWSLEGRRRSRAP